MTEKYCSILTLEVIGFLPWLFYHGKLLRYFYNIDRPLITRKILYIHNKALKFGQLKKHFLWCWSVLKSEPGL